MMEYSKNEHNHSTALVSKAHSLLSQRPTKSSQFYPLKVATQYLGISTWYLFSLLSQSRIRSFQRTSRKAFFIKNNLIISLQIRLSNEELNQHVTHSIAGFAERRGAL